ncbi:PHP domain-containing protein [bacterium]|nr:PHP domain-containing protein [bacterium]
MDWLKADFHAHCGEDVCDILFYTAHDLIDRYAELGFQVMTISNHITLTFSEDWRRYAEEKGMLLIPGVEASIDNKHVLILNADEDANRIRTFDDLKTYKASHDSFIVAPHPFSFASICLNDDTYKHADLFDGVEWHHFYTRGFNPNLKAKQFAAETGKTLIANSDCHDLGYLGEVYTLVKAAPTWESISSALRRGEVEIKTQPLSTLRSLYIHHILRMGQVRRSMRRLLPHVFYKDHPYPITKRERHRSNLVENRTAKKTKRPLRAL